MKPARFDYVRAETLAEAHAVLAESGGEARVLAGGQSLMPMLSMRLARPNILVDIMRIPGLAEIAVEGGVLRVGARITQAQLLAWPDLSTRLPLLAAALPWVGHAQTRSSGTVCGSVAHADPSAEIPLALLALGGEVELSSRKTRRRVAAQDFFVGTMSTARRDDELIEAVRFPLKTPGDGFAFREVGRRHGDFAIVSVAVLVRGDTVRVAIGGVADRPQARDFRTLDGAALADALDQFAWSLEARDDLHATARYRRDLVRSFGRDVIEEARRCRG
ncbi:FAD binding domain-containing protein [Rhodoplanes roseus]|uniref:Carbon monoxide dehydrogenase n=1 Tax=Rhodoplanes roseus TaxID=29409 RepID=A0A327LAK5_9BRAD|nr:FAD binding domain-containing protein [Rhodoplanes roseus]RAI44758.1 carbon monoxide dehydrogenase [Rhodoplanes roseus]